MESGANRDVWQRTVYDTDEWAAAWARSTVEQLQVVDAHSPPLYLMDHSPFWEGYEIETGTGRIWDRPVIAVGSVYAGYGPAYLAADRDRVRGVLDRGEGLVKEWDAPGLLVLNLPADAAAVWESVRAPDSRLRLDSAYAKRIGSAPDGVLGDIGSHDRTEWRRRWRRAVEKGVRLVEETKPSDTHIDEVVALTNASAVRHGWPELYDRTTVREVLGVPGSQLLRAVWSDRTIGGFVTLRHDRRLYLWAGGIDHTVLREVSPYLFMLYELLSTGADRGLDLIEFGKGNDDFKRKHGFVGTELWSLWYAATPEEAAVHGPRLASLHNRLTSLQGD